MESCSQICYLLHPGNRGDWQGLGGSILQMETLRVSEVGTPPKCDRMGQGQRQGPTLGGRTEKLEASGLRKRPDPILISRSTSTGPWLSAFSSVKWEPFLGEHVGTTWCMVGRPLTHSHSGRPRCLPQLCKARVPVRPTASPW